ncbi:hypothetical protein [Leifsonia virtsii]|uniref:Flp pilus-assembly TadG-like N-terminal domain-containing protein n=1 Tax=Leifsonia virtsii TaxID=3035915 RepID=A0ABT8IWZ0_9MICO|nr:hypothetical protein [Leifsonia virtsii]MDN4597341.1 hypothetical protein [Leifsonia virtsii]
MALASVIGIGAALFILVGVTLAASVGGLRKSSGDQDWNAAMSAAYAGVEDYQAKLANDNTYQQYGNSNAPFSSTSSFTSTNGNPAFGVGSGGSWATVPGSGNRAFYRYEVDNSKYSTSGTLRLRSTGWVGSMTRSIVADLKQSGFIDFLYFTDYEIQDPATSSTSCTPAYAWAVSSRPNCTTIQFAAADTINGPVHSNDTLQICGTTFNNIVTTGYKPTSGPAYIIPSGCSAGTFAISGYPRYSPVVAMPSTNTQMKQETRTDLTTVPRPGCLYTGPTTITFNNNGTMTVRSPWTKATNVQGDPPTSGSISSQCGTPGYATSGKLGSPAGQTIPVPANNLLFVQTVPSIVGDPNYTAPGSFPSNFTCSNSSGSTGTSNGLGYPTVNEKAPSSSTSAPSYGCRNGDVFVQGAVHAATTVAADNYVYIVGDVTYVDSQADMLGLVGQNAVWVYNPVDSSGNLLDSSTGGREVDAAILSVAHTFQVQNYTAGKKGTLTVKGAIAQKFRGPVAQSSGGTITTGYIKNYVYDARLQYTAPPKFLSPVSTTYGTSAVVEVKTAFAPSGAVIP